MTLIEDAAPSQAEPREVAAGPALLALAAWRIAAKGRTVVLVAADEPDAETAVRALATIAPGLDTVHLPPWDCVPGGRIPPSSAVMAARIAALRRLAVPAQGPRVLVTTAEALLVRSADPAAWDGADLRLQPGQPLDEDELKVSLARLGYRADERVDEPGEYAVRGEVIEIFPADARRPVRLDRSDARIEALRPYDPLTQRSDGELDHVGVPPAAEVRGTDGAAPPHPALAGPGRVDLLARLQDAPVVLAEDAAERGRALLAMAADALAQPRRDLRPDPELLAAAAAWNAFVGRAGPPPAGGPLPDLAATADPGAMLRGLIGDARATGRVVIAIRDPRDLRHVVRMAGPEMARAEQVADWQGVAAAPRGALLQLRGPLDESFRDAEDNVLVIAAADVLGREDRMRTHGAVLADDGEITAGDVVVHEDHGLCRYDGLETIGTPDEGEGETVRLSFAGDDVLLVPAEEAGVLWRYGSAEADAALDSLAGEAWSTRRREVEADMEDAARRIAALVRQRNAARAPACRPAPELMARFAARFPHPATPDQRRAFGDVLADMAGTRPMDRLICGDVGFGKTEVALRAAAAAVFAGRQAAIAAPTTLLARQHLAVFAARFAPFGIAVHELSRFVSPAEARAVKAGLKEGSIKVVVGTHALAGRGIAFADLGVVVIDEEQRFGEAHKDALSRLGRDAHALAMTATPIPRTLQAALAGLRDVSVLATPPIARRPVRTVVSPFDAGLLREQLMAEKARGGRSFVVCPRIADIGPMRDRLAGLVPELAVVALHARMPAREIDDAMLAFAEGEGDVLLSTSIVESGLDVPGADTMVLWRPDRFGLAQLHQLRGRVGRARNRGHCLLLTDPDAPPGPAAMRRLSALAALDQPGAGFAVAARDLDQRGAGDIAGLNQTGHRRRIGVELSRHLLHRALAAARGEDRRDDWRPQIQLGCAMAIPAGYVPEPDLRLSLYRRADRAGTLRAVEALAGEIEDRFGDPPDAVLRWLDGARLAAGCRALGIARLGCGPRGIAIEPRTTGAADRLRRLAPRLDPPLEETGERFLWPRGGNTGPARLQAAIELLAQIARALRS